MNTIGDDVKKIYDKQLADTSGKKPGPAERIKIIILVSIPVLLIFGYIAGGIYYYNGCVRKMNQIIGARVQIEKECKRRDDLLPNLITITKEYARHEKSLFNYIAGTRAQLETAEQSKGGAAAVKSGELLTKLVARAEQYPDLKATKSFQDLMEMIATTEDRIAAMREFYVVNCEDYNICNQTFWCQFFTWYTNVFNPMDPWVDYFYTEQKYLPVVQPEDLSGTVKEGERK